MTTTRTLIVGGGPAAHRLVDALVSRGGARTRSIVVLAEEPYLPYDRVQLSKRLGDGTVDLTLDMTLDANGVLSGTVTIVPVTNRDASCGATNTCTSNVDTVSGARTSP